MASSFSVTKIVDGSRNTTIKIDITGDTNSELTLAKVFDVTQYFNTGINKQLKEVQYELSGFRGQLLWESTVANEPLLSMEIDHYTEAKFDRIGYLKNSDVEGHTGSILLSTLGLTTNCVGYIILFIQSRDIVDGQS